MEKYLKEFRQIPGIGKSMARDLYDLGFRSIADLKTQNPQIMYDKLSVLRSVQMDRCVLYVFRCAVYFAQTENSDHELLKWWNWKDTNLKNIPEEIKAKIHAR